MWNLPLYQQQLGFSFKFFTFQKERVHKKKGEKQQLFELLTLLPTSSFIRVIENNEKPHLHEK